jgi:L-fuconolactonase
VKRHPEIRFVLDHAGKRPHEDAAWERGVRALAELPNVTCKLSGLVTEAEPAATAALALEWFGAARCMFGSDWPVCLLVGAYGDTLELVGDDEDVLARTAIRTYGLELS